LQSSIPEKLYGTRSRLAPSASAARAQTASNPLPLRGVAQTTW
jgi:hypothetical protein